MKTLILTFFLALVGNQLKAQTVLNEENGISLSYTASFVNTINCHGKNVDQYKVTTVLINRSGSPIFRQQSFVRHINSVDATGCAPRQPTADFYSKEVWPDGSTETNVYYVFTASGTSLPDPEWRMGIYRLLKN